MYKFPVPNYKENNIINLMSSISHSFGRKHEYNELKSLNQEKLNNFDNIVLIVIDGLGYNYLKNKKNSFLFKNIHSKLNTTFLSTTACANTAFQVGYPPQQHGLTGWTINLKEVGAITQVLPFTPRYGGTNLSENNFNINKIIDIDSFHKDFKGDCFTIIEKDKAERGFIKHVAKETKIVPCETYKEIYLELKKLINKKSEKRRFIHAYIDDFDAVQHNNGVKSDETLQLFQDIDNKIQIFSESIKGTNTKLIIVADHGLIDLDEKSEIAVEDIPGLSDCLTIPMTGEPRVRDCFVRPSKVKQFKEIIENKMSKYCWCFEGEQLIKDNFYGLGTPHKKLFDRVGDFVLIMKENYVLRDKLINHNPLQIEKASHGAFSDNEMHIPLVIIDC
ncbi:MAG: alkaline phosphatase family protein [Candidatus Gracilibacteria bacterium]|nr:alkaline phosphatase family protein [Candidatus Gracilibacteria bacterium]MDQ7022271.1 alkaline phosphatase family protein [Candidatus Gracilibacteria bacterium]